MERCSTTTFAQNLRQLLTGTDGINALYQLQHRQGLLERCMQAMAMTLHKALVWQRVRNLYKELSRIEQEQANH